MVRADFCRFVLELCPKYLYVWPPIMLCYGSFDIRKYRILRAQRTKFKHMWFDSCAFQKDKYFTIGGAWYQPKKINCVWGQKNSRNLSGWIAVNGDKKMGTEILFPRLIPKKSMCTTSLPMSMKRTHTYTHTHACMHTQTHAHTHQIACMYVTHVLPCLNFTWCPFMVH